MPTCGIPPHRRMGDAVAGSSARRYGGKSRVAFSYVVGGPNSQPLPYSSRQKSACRPEKDIVYGTPAASSDAFSGASASSVIATCRSRPACTGRPSATYPGGGALML